MYISHVVSPDHLSLSLKDLDHLTWLRVSNNFS